MALVRESKFFKSADGIAEGRAKEKKPFTKLAIESMKPEGFKRMPGYQTIGLKSEDKPAGEKRKWHRIKHRTKAA